MTRALAFFSLVALLGAAPARAQDELAAEQLDAPAAHDRQYQSEVAEPHRWRVAAEMGAAMTVGTVWYWMYSDFNLPDWDYPGVEGRVTLTAVRFDTNDLSTNAMMHPLMGAAYYGLARVNGLSIAESALVSFMTSAFWEFIPEYREYVSLNDLVFTPVGGVPLGEVILHLGDYFNSAPDGGSWVHAILEDTIGLPRSIHRSLDEGPRPGAGGGTDRLGLSNAFWHRFGLELEMTGATDSSAPGESTRFYGLVLRTELVAVPGHLRPGKFHGLFTEGELTEAMLRLGWADGELRELHVRARAILAGWLAQDLRSAGGGDLDGWALEAGLASALDYHDWAVSGRADRLGAAHVLGLAANLRMALPARGWLRFGGEAYGDFTGVESAALGRWSEQNGGTEGLMSVLDRHGYYYAYGATGALTAGVELWGFELLGHLRWGGWRSIEGLDRWADRVTRTVSLEDEITEYGVELSYGPPDHGFRLRLGLEGMIRRGQLDDTVVRIRQGRALIAGGSRF